MQSVPNKCQLLACRHLSSSQAPPLLRPALCKEGAEFNFVILTSTNVFPQQPGTIKGDCWGFPGPRARREAPLSPDRRPAQRGENPASPGPGRLTFSSFYIKILCIFHEFLVVGPDELKSERTRGSERSLCPALWLLPPCPPPLGGAGGDMLAGTGRPGGDPGTPRRGDVSSGGRHVARVPRQEPSTHRAAKRRLSAPRVAALTTSGVPLGDSGETPALPACALWRGGAGVPGWWPSLGESVPPGPSDLGGSAAVVTAPTPGRPQGLAQPPPLGGTLAEFSPTSGTQPL